jgi:hypothetical protein|tara:strand:- start:611 stop:955 length:345 start_codon:yes stop_codon:yes gene_type:complete
MTKLYWSIGAQLIAAILAFFQLQGHYVWPKVKFLSSIWWIYITSIIIAPLFFYATKWSYEHFGAFWNMRLAGFGIGTLIFGILTWLLIGEIPTLKTVICLLLAVAIILIQITNL